MVLLERVIDSIFNFLIVIDPLLRVLAVIAVSLSVGYIGTRFLSGFMGWG